jgi:hypothetical protein
MNPIRSFVNSRILNILCIALMAGVLACASGCARIATGEVGLRVDVNNQTLPGELMPGSWNQTLVGHVLEFPVRDVPLVINNAHPITKDNTALDEFDLTAAYSINQACVFDLWTKKSRTFHGSSESGEWLLMQSFVQNTLNSAAYKAVRSYDALVVNDNRDQIGAQVHELAKEVFKENGLETCLSINSVQVKTAKPAEMILQSARLVVTKANELKAKEAEVAIAEAEAHRLSALSQNTGNMALMQLENQKLIAQAIHEGKVQTIVLPMDFKGMVNLGGK